MAIVTGPTNAAIAAHLFGLLLSLLAPFISRSALTDDLSGMCQLLENKFPCVY